MRYLMARTLTAVLLLLAMLVQGTWALAGTTGSISGTVVQNNGAPLVGATVAVVSPSQSTSTQTNAQGHFAFASLSPDTYTLTVNKPGYQTISQAGVTVTADQEQRLAYTAQTTLQQIGRTQARANTDLVRAGTMQDVYVINPAQQQAVQGLGGGGSLNQAYSAIASLPGVYVPQGQQGWAQSVYIRGGNYTSLGYEYDGIPTQRAFDAYPGGTVTALGQQELQVYTGSAPADASSNGLAGFINQVIRTGTYPLSKTAVLGWGGPALYHKGQFEISGATPSRSISYYGAAAGYVQDFRYGDQFFGAKYTNDFSGSFYNQVRANCGTPQATSGCYQSGNASVGISDGPSGFLPFPIAYGANDRNTAAEAVANLHFGIPHKNGSRDDVQFLINSSFNRGQFQSNDAFLAGPVYNDLVNGTATYNGVTYPSCGSLPATSTAPCGVNNPVNPNGAGLPAPYTDQMHFGGPLGTALTPAMLGTTFPFFQPKSRQHPYGGPITDPNYRDSQDINSSVVKLQYQRNFGSDSYLRIYGYTFFTDWLNGNGSPSLPYGNLNGSVVATNSPDYDLISHERGVSATFVKQLSDKHLLNATGSYVTANTIRWNDNYWSAASFGSVRPVALLVDATNPTGGCYRTAAATMTTTPIYCGNADAYRLPPINGTYATGLRPTGAATLGNVGSLTCGGHPCEFLTVGDGSVGSFNTVRPKFTSAVISDSWKPNGRLSLDLALKWENFQYDLPNTTTPASAYGEPVSTVARTLFTNSYNATHCYSLATGVVATAGNRPGPCPAGTTPITFSSASPSSISFGFLSPRFGATYEINRENVLRFSAGKYIQPTNTAYTQYNRVEPNLAAYDVQKFWGLGFNTPGHEVRPEKSYNFDFSWEHQFHGTDASMKLTPFYRSTKDEQDQVLLDPVTNFVSAINIGQKKVLGVELLVRKGDFARNGLSGQFSYTYTHATIRFGTLPNGTSPLDQINSQVKQYNGYTSFCATHASDSRCGTPLSGAAAAPCYDSTGAAIPSTVACVNGTTANPYWNAPVQPLFDTNAEYTPYNQLPGSGLAGVVSSYVIPHVASLVVNYRHDRFAITPSLQIASGGRYGGPTNGYGVSPDQCPALVGTGIDPLRYPYGGFGNGYDAENCAPYRTSAIGVPTNGITAPDRFTGQFDTFGAFREPTQLVGNLQVSYDLNKRVTLTVLGTNLISRCFGGESKPWTQNGDGRVNCWYGAPTQYVGNFFNPGAPQQYLVQYPYTPFFGNVFQSGYASSANPINLFVNLSVKI